jgi:hypothetical protein
MRLVQILLPVRDNRGKRFPGSYHAEVHHTLAARFGGVTAYTRAPAKGVWRHKGRARVDDVVVIEVMVRRFSPRWWKNYRVALERFQQHTLIIRVQDIRLV